MKTIKLSNGLGDKIELLSLGARLTHWSCIHKTKDKNIVLRYSNDSEYLQDRFYMCAVVGPYANRIANSELTINGNIIRLQSNEGPHHLHGAKQGLHLVDWEVINQCSDSVELFFRQGKRCTGANDKIKSDATTVDWTIRYTIEDHGKLVLELEAIPEADTVIGPTGHAYFNLTGEKTPIDSHLIKVNASHYTPLNQEQIPTGEITLVDEDINFSKKRPVNTQLDHNFVLDNKASTIALNSIPYCTSLISPQQNLALHVYSDYPGIQIYTGQHLRAPFISRQGICLEPQFFPNSPNQPHFPFQITKANTLFKKTIVYQLEQHSG